MVTPASITSRRHDLVQRCRRLATGRTAADPALLLDGPHLLAVALASGCPLDVVAVTTGLDEEDGEIRGLVARARAAGVAVATVAAPVMEAMSPVRAPSGVLAIGRPREAALPDLAAPAPALVVAVIDVQDPGNVGAILRSADAFGATGVACLGASADPFGWKSLRGSMGSALRLPVVRERDAASALHVLRQQGLSIVAAGLRGGPPADWRLPCALVVGSEGRGLPESVVAGADATVTIPMRRGVESLNVAVAAGILLHDARAQRDGRLRP